ncbi:MAG TPA: DUF6515 family protein [Steroidobacteraceae bacterium]|jgi:hypothetical protein|nr:DUF6515 family protein [Steroidobacteraceae bacterium]
MKRVMRAQAGVALGLALALAALGAQAEPHQAAPSDRGEHYQGRSEHYEGRGAHYDARYSHNHYYADRGVMVRGVPGSPYVVARHGGRYYYSGGVWYAPRGPGFVVVGAPFGVFVPVLPPFYTTLWVGGFPYYYANDTYYAWRADQNGYEVVEPPSEQGAATTQEPPSDDLFIYPQNGQSEQQQSNDKYECHRWASSQTGFDPTQSAGGISPDQVAAKRVDYQRAMRACLEGRGYSVR